MSRTVEQIEREMNRVGIYAVHVDSYMDDGQRLWSVEATPDHYSSPFTATGPSIEDALLRLISKIDSRTRSLRG